MTLIVLRVLSERCESGRPFRERLDDRLQHDPPVGAADALFTGALGVRHQSDDVPRGVADAGDVVQRAVRVRPRRNGRSPGGSLRGRERLGIGEVVAFAVRDGQRSTWPPSHASGERRVGLLDAHVDVP